jgi:hypothetical protein
VDIDVAATGSTAGLLSALCEAIGRLHAIAEAAIATSAASPTYPLMELLPDVAGDARIVTEIRRRNAAAKNCPAPSDCRFVSGAAYSL